MKDDMLYGAWVIGIILVLHLLEMWPTLREKFKNWKKKLGGRILE